MSYGPERLQKVDKLLDQVGVRALTRGELFDISTQFEQDLRSGIYALNRPRSLAMIDTLLEPVHKEGLIRAKGKEAVVLEIGGTNVYATRVRAESDGKLVFVQTGDSDYYEGQIQGRVFNSPKEYFREILRPVETVFRPGSLEHLAIIFSFPAKALKTARGVDVNAQDDLTKGFTITGLHTQSVGEAFMEFLRSEGYPVSEKIRIVVLNDTPAVMLAIPGCKIGGVVGTGYNLAIRIHGKTYNTEAGGFSGVPTNLVATKVNEMSDNRNKQLGEKQISGLYLGRQMEYLIGEANKLQVLKNMYKGPLSGKFIRDVLVGDRSAIRQYVDGNVDGLSLFALQHMAEKLVLRSAQLVGTEIAAVVRAFPNEFLEGTVTVSMEGSVFWQMPWYGKHVNEAAQTVAGKSFTIPPITRPGVLGAAAAVLGS